MSEVQEQLWSTRRDGFVRGPFTEMEISQSILLGRIRPDDELSVDQQVWTSVRELPYMVPEVMKHVETEEDCLRLQAARIAADERRHADRRRGSERMHMGAGDRRRSVDRRHEDEQEAMRPQIKPVRVVDTDPVDEDASLSQGKITLMVVCVLALLFIIFTPDAPEVSADCTAPVGPRVQWDNCKMPGLVAEQANLRGAQARNMDLTGARLIGANLIGSDLAYTVLNLADLRHADFSNARMTGASLKAADLRGARLAGADLSYTDLSTARLEGAVLSETRFDNAVWVDGRSCKPGSIGQCLE